MSIQVTATRVSKASKDSVWKAMADLENWPKWVDSTRKTRIISQKIVSREGNTVVLDVEEVVNGSHGKHSERVTFYPKEKIEGVFVTGPLRGSNSMSCTETPQGTRIDMSFDVAPSNIVYRILGFFMNFKKMLQGVTDEYCKQLSDYAEAHP